MQIIIMRQHVLGHGVKTWYCYRFSIA